MSTAKMSVNPHAATDWQHRIRENFPFLVEHLSCLEDLSDHLISKLVFTPHDADVVQNGGPDRTQRVRSRRFLHCLLEKGPDAYPAFTEALEIIGCGFIVAQLETPVTNQPCSDGSSNVASGDMPADETSWRYSSGAYGHATPLSQGKNETTPTVHQEHPVQHFHINRPNQVFIGQTSFGTPQSTVSDTLQSSPGECPKSLLIALLKEILFHCHGKKEALYTLEEKLCTRLREEGRKHIVSFEEHFQMSFREFLARNSQDFDVAKVDNELIVSRVKDRRGTVPVLLSPKPSEKGPESENAWTQRLNKNQSQGSTEQPEQTLSTPVCQNKERTMVVLSPKKGVDQKNIQATDIKKKTSSTQQPHSLSSCVETAYPDLKDAKPSEQPKAQTVEVVAQAAPEQPRRKAGDDSFVSTYIAKAPCDTLVFKTSPDAYKDDHAQFTIDIISLWNTPDRDDAIIILGVKQLVNPPHQVVGLRSGSSNAYYQKIFLRKLFDFRPQFTYKEVMHDGKRVGIIKVGKSAGAASPSIVKSDKKKPLLKKNQLWVREGGKNVALEGSDMDNALVKRVYSWFMQQETPREQSAAQSKLPLEDTLIGNSAGPSSGIMKNIEMREDTVNTSSDKETLTEPKIRTQEMTENKVDSEELVASSTQLATELKRTQDVKPANNEMQSGSTIPKGIQAADKETSNLMEALAHFKKGHFILLSGTLANTVPNLHALSVAPWIAVYDFDVSSREPGGLLAYLEEGLKRTRSTSVSTWMDQHTGVTERGTQWWSLRGRLDVPASNLSDLSPLKWLQKVCEKVEKLCVELARFSQDYTVLSILVLWPNSKEEMKCMQKFLNKLMERVHVQPSIMLWFTDPTSDQTDSFEVQSIAADSEGNVRSFYASLEKFCSEVDLLFANTSDPAFLYRLPSENGTTVDINLEQASILKQDFEVLYIQNPYSKEDLTIEVLEQERENFFRGGSIRWIARYDMGATCFDVERSRSRDVIEHIQRVYIKEFRGGVVELFHAPGSGGSTMSQRILFHFHEIIPCVHIKQRSGSPTEEIAEWLAFLHDHTHMPVLALLDGEDEQKLQQLKTQLRHCNIIFLWVRRYPHAINRCRPCIAHQGRFFLEGVVNEQESRHLVLQFGNCCKGAEGKLRALKALDLDVQKKQQTHQMFEYGLTVYDHEYQGVRAYVKGYLQIEQNEGMELTPWQKGLGYLSLVYYYAQAALPCQFFRSLMGESTSKVLSIDDLPHQVSMLVVPDANEGRSQYVRIMHYAIATEILEQILNKSDKRSGDGKLSREAMRNLKDFCVNFLDQTVKESKKSALTALTVVHILTRTFFVRDRTEALDLTTEEKKAPPPFSQVMLDLDSQAPYHGRLEVFQKLCDICPDNPNFKAHLGRFYSLCQPEKEEAAERSFKEAIKLAQEGDCRTFTETRDEHNLDLMFIHHMYACFFQKKNERRIGVTHSFHALDNPAFTQSLHETIADAEGACQHFSLSRQYSPLHNQEAHPYLNEIDVRLRTCKFILHSFPGGAQSLLQSWQQFGTNYKFVKTSILEVEDLIMECYNRVFLDDETLGDLQKRVQRFNDLFRGCANELQTLADDDPLTSLRLKLTAKKLQYDQPGNVVLVENPDMPSDVIQYVVETYEQIFDHEAFNHATMKTKLELDYRHWILALRNPNFNQDYTVERVLEVVRRWQASVHSPQSVATFYLFVLLSLLGFGTTTKSGHEECLAEAQRLKDKIQKLSRTDPKARQPREWLGRDEALGIRRLIPHSHISLENHRLTSAASGRLVVCKGTVLGKPRKPAGFINMDVHYKGNERPSVKVFFVPARVDTTCTLYKGARVQFYLGFSQEIGYEAFEVKVVKKYMCRSCGYWTEITTDQTSVTCNGKDTNGKTCDAKVFRN